jgi:hypothetical protein
MKTMIVLTTLTVVCLIPGYSQFKVNRKANSTIEAFSFDPKSKGDVLPGPYVFSGKVGVLPNHKAPDNFRNPAIGSVLSKKMSDTFSADNMPCAKPFGIFSMRVYKPDASINYHIKVKDYN